MNREIKFRALKDDVSNCNFVYGRLIYDSDAMTPRIQYGSGFTFSTCFKGTEGQFIGMKDRDGKEIYEGDIVQKYNWGVGGEMLGVDVIEWDIDILGWNFRTGIDDIYDIRKALSACKVIGNIYENADLLTFTDQ